MEGKETQPSGASDCTESHATGTSGASSSASDGCTCDFCNGVPITHERTDPRTGLTVDKSFEKMSRRTRCPNCGGKNLLYRASFVAHVADLIRRAGVRREHVRLVHCTLDRATADIAGVDGWDDSYKVLTGDGGAWTLAIRRVRRSDGAVAYIGTLSARISDGRAHVHALVITSLTAHELQECMHVKGLDVVVQTPAPTESAEKFAANAAAYAYDNHAASGSARFIASRGAGYDSAEAKERRQLHAMANAAASGDGALGDGVPIGDGVGIEVDNDESTLDGAVESAGERAGERRNDGASLLHYPKDGRAPPVACGSEVVSTVTSYRQTVRRALSRRMGSYVHVKREGACMLLRVYEASADAAYLQCEVAIGGTDVRWVPWHRIDAAHVPLIETRTLPYSPRNAMPTDEPTDAMEATQEATQTAQPTDPAQSDDPVERFNAAARTSKVTTRLPDGRRRVSVKDHETGEVTESILPPDEKWQAYHG